MTKLIINGLMNDEEIRWKKIKCCCSKVEGDVEHQHPIGDCKHCKFQQCEDSIPRETFTASDNKYDKDGKITKKQNKTVTQINIVRGEKYHDIIGWTF
tara:strand:+ start:241 stop:534 length:294 start_codon:yes stop_codon:yes gene_type:complete